MNATSRIAVSPTTAAAMLGISRTKIYELLYTQIPVKKIGRRSLILVADIERWLAEQPPEPRPNSGRTKAINMRPGGRS